MSTPFPPVVPLPDDGSPRGDDVPTREVDGREILDPDIDGGQIDSAEADRVATTGDDDLEDDEDDGLGDDQDELDDDFDDALKDEGF